jgi:hypothetical protein
VKPEPFDRARIEQIKAEWPDWEERFSAPLAPATTAPKTDIAGRPRKFDIGKWRTAKKQKKERTGE